ncbi:MAG: septum formation protein Maf [Clostridia bacterium]|nr:septum formation protein Maf [Clostridia bacterium]
MEKIILASKSPRRCELLQNIGLEFEIIPDDSPEIFRENLSPEELCMAIAKDKGDNVYRDNNLNEELVISADTIVVIDGTVLGKPKDRDDAHRMLKHLSGREHSVFTALYIRKGQITSLTSTETKVRFKELTEEEILWYVSTGESDDKAGAYGIQNLGSLLIEGINGDYFNVVGLPICTLGNILKSKFNFVFNTKTEV